MEIDWQQVRQVVTGSLSAAEKSGSIAYLDERILPARSQISMGEMTITAKSDSALAFIDREPGANWGHSSRYVIVDLHSLEMQSYDSQFPPFLRGYPVTLRVIWKGQSVPDWAVATP